MFQMLEKIIPVFLIFLTHRWIERVLFLWEIFEMDTLMGLQVLRFLELKNYIFTVGQCVCLCVCGLCDGILTGTPNLVLYICITYRYYLKISMNIRQIVCVQVYAKYSNKLWSMMGICCQLIFVHLDCTRCNEINMHFWDVTNNSM